MALPTATGYWNYPYQNSPERSFYQAFNSGATDGALLILGTVSSTNKFCLTKLMVSVTNPTSGSTVAVKLKNDTIFEISGTTISSHTIEFSPPGVLSAVADTATAELRVTGNTCGACCFIAGYYE